VTNRPSDVTQAKIQLKNVSNSSQLPNAPISTQVHPAAFELKNVTKAFASLSVATKAPRRLPKFDIIERNRERH